jgi:GT2 family glycosyltransferase
MIRRELFQSLGGFDPSLRVAFSDVDLCLRAAAAGHRTVWTPHATLAHHESATRSRVDPRADVAEARRRWGRLALQGDPFVSPNLDLDAGGRAIRAR